MENAEKVYTDYGVIGGTEAELDSEKSVLNSKNEWQKEIQKYLVSGQLQGGTLAIKNRHAAKSPRLMSNKQRAALRR
jgi:hypothetical protein